MPANAPIVINDGAASPIAHTFNPQKIDGNMASFQEVVSGVPIGYPKLTVSSREPVKGGAGVYRVVYKITQPSVVTTTDTSGKTVTSVDHTDSVELTMLISQTSTTAQRKNLRVLAANALLNATLAKTIDDLEFFW